MATNYSLPSHARIPVSKRAVELIKESGAPETVDSGQPKSSTSPAAMRDSNAEHGPPRLQHSPSSPVKIRIPSIEALQPSEASLEDAPHNMTNSRNTTTTARTDGHKLRSGAIAHQKDIESRSPVPQSNLVFPLVQQHQGEIPQQHITSSRMVGVNRQVGDVSLQPETPTIHLSTMENEDESSEQPRLQYFHFTSNQNHTDSLLPRANVTLRHPARGEDNHPPPSGERQPLSPKQNDTGVTFGSQTQSDKPPNLSSDLNIRGRSLSPAEIHNDRHVSSSGQHRRDLSSASSRKSLEPRPNSYVDLLNVPYTQQMAQQNMTLDNAKLRAAVGTNASLLDTKKTLDMYRANLKKTNDPTIQYEFAIFMVNAAQEAAALTLNGEGSKDGLTMATSQTELLREARNILQRLADKSYVFAQYYLADGYASGLFNNGKEDYERGFPLFLSAAKHGHAEAGYRTALCYEFGWGCRKDFAKAVQFFRQSASKNHPGAAIRLGKACLTGDMGLVNKHKEGVKWLKRATESADLQHNSGPFELGLLHLTGYGDDIFKDEAYAAQLFTKSAELGHAEANLRMGEAYEHGLLTCPRDPALSIHFYTGAAQAGVPRAMMALCAWYMVGAEPLLEKDEGEAYEWAKKAAETGFPKAEYAIGYFTEMGIGCRRDPLEANVWYVKAADQGDERARQRLAIIREAETGDMLNGNSKPNSKNKVRKKRSAANGSRDEKDCLVM